MPMYYIALSLTPPSSPRDGDVIQLLRRAVEIAMCVAIEISARGMIVECDAASITALEEAIRGELAAHGGSLDRISIQRI
jgi:hypothetical protein